MNYGSYGHKHDPKSPWHYITQSEYEEDKESAAFLLIGLLFEFIGVISKIMWAIYSSNIESHGVRLEESILIIEGRLFHFHYK